MIAIVRSSLKLKASSLKCSVLILAAFAALWIGGCANTTTSKYKFSTADGKSGSIELPKDIHATGLKIKTSSGAVIEADEITSIGRVDQTLAQGQREEANLGKASDIAGKVTEGAVKGAIKGTKGF